MIYAAARVQTVTIVAGRSALTMTGPPVRRTLGAADIHMDDMAPRSRSARQLRAWNWPSRHRRLAGWSSLVCVRSDVLCSVESIYRRVWRVNGAKQARLMCALRC